MTFIWGYAIIYNTPLWLENTKERIFCKMEEKQLRYQKMLFALTLVNTIIMVLILVMLAGALMFILPRVEEIYSSAMISLRNLEETSNALRNADIEGLVANMNNLTDLAVGDLTELKEKIDSIDFQALNDSIQQFTAVISPLSRFFSGR